MAKRDYYEVLEVTRTVEFEEIKRSYRKLAVKHHPDKNPGDSEAEARFREIAEAYDILGDPEKRSAYDRYGHAAFQGGAAGGGGAHDPFDLFREMFGASGGGGGIFDHFFGGGGGGASQEGRGSDLRYDLRITLDEAFTGCEKEIELRKLDACVTCNGSGAAKGAKVSTCSLCRGRGQVVASRGFFQVAQPCPQCHGAGQTIDKPCRSCDGQGRAEKTSRIKLNIPAGIDEGSRLRSTGGGEAGARGGGTGDLALSIAGTAGIAGPASLLDSVAASGSSSSDSLTAVTALRVGGRRLQKSEITYLVLTRTTCILLLGAADGIDSISLCCGVQKNMLRDAEGII